MMLRYWQETLKGTRNDANDVNMSCESVDDAMNAITLMQCLPLSRWHSVLGDPK